MAEERIWEKAVNALRSEACSPGHRGPGSKVPLPRAPVEESGGWGALRVGSREPGGQGEQRAHTPANRGTLA